MPFQIKHPPEWIDSALPEGFVALIGMPPPDEKSENFEAAYDPTISQEGMKNIFVGILIWSKSDLENQVY